MIESKRILTGNNEFIEFNIPNSNAHYNIDNFLQPTAPFWKVIELNCQSECCGLLAYCFLPSTLIKYGNQFFDKSISQKFNTLLHKIKTLDHNDLKSEILNDSFSKQDFIRLLQFIITYLNTGIELNEK